jgi:hypothetical protein
MAKRSATECAGIFDICQRLQIIDEKNYSIGRELLIRIVAMLTKLARVSLKVNLFENGRGHALGHRHDC